MLKQLLSGDKIPDIFFLIWKTPVDLQNSWLFPPKPFISIGYSWFSLSELPQEKSQQPTRLPQGGIFFTLISDYFTLIPWDLSNSTIFFQK